MSRDEQATLTDATTGDEDAHSGQESASALSPSSPAEPTADDSRDEEGGVRTRTSSGASGRSLELVCENAPDCSYEVAVGGNAPGRSRPRDCRICGGGLVRP